MRGTERGNGMEHAKLLKGECVISAPLASVHRIPLSVIGQTNSYSHPKFMPLAKNMLLCLYAQTNTAMFRITKQNHRQRIAYF